MDTILPLTKSNLGLVESAFLQPDGSRYGVAVGLGASSRLASGKCMARHFNGACWGTFSGADSRYVDTHDHDISCVLDENYVTHMKSGNAANASNSMVQYVPVDPASQRSNGPWLPQGPSPLPDIYNNSMRRSSRPCASYGSYDNCPNCSLSGAAAYDCRSK